MPPDAPPLDPSTLQILAAGAEDADRRADWPAASWDALRQAGVLAWAIPTEHGGRGLAPATLLDGSQRLARECLTTAFLLSQREAAVRRLVVGAAHLRDQFLPSLARGEVFLTVGVSQLTTSRQHRGPSLRATPLGPAECPDGYQLDGEIPWVTGADHADALVTGAVLPDGLQVLFVLPARQPGVTIEPPLALTALAGSRTSLVRCAGVILDAQWLLAGPNPLVLGKGGGGGLETSGLALGLARAALDELTAQASRRPDLASAITPFQTAWLAAQDRLHQLAAGTGTPEQVLELRVVCTRLALRASQAVLTVCKGAGFVAPHPAQRWARQALFFLVWSCPRPVADDLLADLAPIA